MIKVVPVLARVMSTAQSRRTQLVVFVAASLALAGLVCPPAVSAASVGPSLVLPDLSVYPITGQQVWDGYTQLYTEVQTAPDPSSGEAVDSIELVVPGFGEQTVAAPSGGSGAITFTLPSAFSNQVSGYVVAVDDAGATSEQAPVLIVRHRYSAHLTYDSGATRNGIPQLEGDDAHITVVPQWFDGPMQTTSWLTDIEVQFDLRPVGALSGLQAFAPVTVDLHDADGTAFNAGEHQLSICATDNHGNQHCENPAVFVVNPVTATWVVGTTQPDTPTTVTATIHNDTASAIHSLTLRLRDGTEVASVLDPVGATPSISASMTFAPGGNYPNVIVTLANGNTYRVFDEVISMIDVSTTLDPPAEPSWGDDINFRAQAVSSRGTAQAGLAVHLQSRAPGSTTWVSRATALTNKYGKAVMAVPAATTGSASWRVTSSRTKIQKPSASAAHLVRVRAAFGRLPAPRTVRIRQTSRYTLAIRPALSGMHIDVQYRRVGTVRWTTLNRTAVETGSTALAVRLTTAGRYRIRVRVEPTTRVTATASASWALRVVK